MRLAIADPPYPPQLTERYDAKQPRVVSRSRSRRWYGDQAGLGGNHAADYHPAAAEWDDPRRHRALLEQLMDEYDGWAIATCPDGLEAYRPLPIPARLMVWVKLRPLPTGHRVATTWEPVILFPPRPRRARTPGVPQVPDVITCAPPAVGFAGAKPEAWTRWVLAAMGHESGDVVVDLFPGSGAIQRVLDQPQLEGFAPGE